MCHILLIVVKVRPHPHILPSASGLWPVCASARASCSFTRVSCVNIGQVVTQRYVEWLDNALVTGSACKQMCIHTVAHKQTCTYTLVPTIKERKG